MTYVKLFVRNFVLVFYLYRYREYNVNVDYRSTVSCEDETNKNHEANHCSILFMYKIIIVHS